MIFNHCLTPIHLLIYLFFPIIDKIKTCDINSRLKEKNPHFVDINNNRCVGGSSPSSTTEKSLSTKEGIKYKRALIVSLST